MGARRGSVLRWPYAEAVSVKIAEFDFGPPGCLLDLKPELGSHRVDIVHTQIDKGVWVGVSSVFGEEDPHGSARDGHEERKAWLKAVLPLLCEAKAGIPGCCGVRVVGAKNRRDLLSHATIIAV